MKILVRPAIYDFSEISTTEKHGWCSLKDLASALHTTQRAVLDRYWSLGQNAHNNLITLVAYNDAEGAEVNEVYVVQTLALVGMMEDKGIPFQGFIPAPMSDEILRISQSFSRVDIITMTVADDDMPLSVASISEVKAIELHKTLGGKVLWYTRVDGQPDTYAFRVAKNP